MEEPEGPPSLPVFGGPCSDSPDPDSDCGADAMPLANGPSPPTTAGEPADAVPLGRGWTVSVDGPSPPTTAGEPADAVPLGRGWTVLVETENNRVRTLHRCVYVGLELVVDPLEGASPDDAAINALQCAPEFDAPWIKFWDRDEDALRYMDVDSGRIAWNLTKMESIAALEAAEEPYDPWIKMYSAVRRQVLYHNHATREVVESVEACRISDRMEGTPDPPPPWSKEWDPERQAVVYARAATNSRLSTLAEVDIEERAMAAAPDVELPWGKRYDIILHRVSYHNRHTGTAAETIADVAKADLLEDTPDPPLPWIKEVGDSWHSAGGTKDLLADENDEEDVTEAAEASAGRPARPKALMTWYLNPETGAKALDLSDVHALDGLQHAADPGPKWQTQWEPTTKSVQYLRVGTAQIVASIEAVRADEALEMAPAVGDGWEKAWDATQQKVYYFNADKSVWSIEEAQAEIELARAPDLPASCTSWVKFWSQDHRCVLYRHVADPTRVLQLVAEVAAAEALEAAPMLMGGDWMKFWSHADQQVCYRHIATGLVAATFAEACVAAAPNPPNSGWQKRWSVETASVVYVNIETHHTSDYTQICIAHAFEVAPEPGDGWAKVWDARAGAVVFQHGDTARTVPTIADVVRCTVFASAPDPGTGWGKGYDAETTAVFFINFETETRADSIEEVNAENARLAVQVVVAPTSGNWTKRWSAEKNAVEFVNKASAYVVGDIAIADAVDAVPSPGHPWTKFWHDDCREVMFKHGVTGQLVGTLAEVKIANEITMAPDPGGHWTKKWSTERSRVYYQSKSSAGPVAWSIHEVESENQRKSLIEAPDADPPWTKSWSFAKSRVYYHNPTTGCRAWSMLEVEHANAVVAAPYIGEEWKRIWSEENDQVVYEHVETKFVAKTLAETAIGEALADAPSPREEDAVFWKKAWNAERARVVYRHEQSNTEVSSIEVIRVIEAAPAPMEDAKFLHRFHKVKKKKKVWDLETASVHYKDEDSGHVFATVAEAEVWTKLKSSPDAGPDWQTVWSKKHDKVMYRHVASRKRVESADEAIIAGKVIDAPDVTGQADGQWEKVWNAALETVCYRNAAGREVATAEEAEIFSAVEAAPDPPPRWRKKWSKMRSRVLYKHRTRDGLVAGSIEDVLRLEDQWDPPIPGWEKESDPDYGVIYVHKETRTVKTTFKAAMVHSAADPGVKRWFKRWDDTMMMVVYINERSKQRANCVDDILDAEREVALGLAEEPPLGFAKDWDLLRGAFYRAQPGTNWIEHAAYAGNGFATLAEVAAHQNVVMPNIDGWSRVSKVSKKGAPIWRYKSLRDGKMAKTVKDAKLHDSPEPDQPGWERVWIESAGEVCYRRTGRFLQLVADGVTNGYTADLTAWADVKLNSIADVRRLHFLEQAPEPPQGWKKHWDAVLGRGCYLDYASSPMQKVHTIEEIVELSGHVNVDFPESFVCPITYDLMADPVVAPDGNSYERFAIEQWLQHHATSPISRQPMQSGQLIPNRSLKDAIEEWQHRHTVHSASPAASAPPLLGL